MTLFRCAAALSEAYEHHGIDKVIFGLLEEVALKIGVDPDEVYRQITCGIQHGRRGSACRS